MRVRRGWQEKMHYRHKRKDAYGGEDGVYGAHERERKQKRKEQNNTTEKSRAFQVFRVFQVFRFFRIFRAFRAFRSFRAYQPLWWILFGGAVLFVIILSQGIPWYALIMLLILGMMVFGGVIGQILQAVKARTTTPPVYQPPEHPAASAKQPSPTPYTQGYQAQPLSANAPGRSPFVPANAEPQPHQDRLGEVYEQPMVQYPEQQ
jgi:hypothetical protein